MSYPPLATGPPGSPFDHPQLAALIDHPSYALMLTVDEEEDRMVDRHLTLYLAPNRLRDEIRVHINLSQR